ncbi:DUF3806 domain-containing protein [Aestuariicella sp. G3-2]|uniref:DUF3806 domain-containing protein n=1 Tax=Pseudomaricurvus albidus TaxID=2842452 RepID=UPI001C0C9334|nr:DUF3806 domain-containing protein [Aestuariicella albida]MBU3070046.1 DUF3806 domain-containing protein [Aestuariicella albida]
MRSLAHFLIILCCLSAPVWANSDGPVEITDLNWLQNQHTEQQIKQIDEITRTNFGEPIRGTKADLELLQRIINKGLISKEDHLAQQALGAVLGDVMVKDMGLEWKSYKDKLGKSRAACAPGTEQCLFPITMLSRRMAVGILPNVADLYQETSEMIKPYLPQNPYDAAVLKTQATQD